MAICEKCGHNRLSLNRPAEYCAACDHYYVADDLDARGEGPIRTAYYVPGHVEFLPGGEQVTNYAPGRVVYAPSKAAAPKDLEV